MTDRPTLHAALDTAINALTKGYRVTEYVEVANVQTTTTRRGKQRKSTAAVRVRRAQHTWMEALIVQLRTADPPATVDTSARDSYTKSGFESRPPVELATLSVLREIIDGTKRWAALLAVNPDGDVTDTLQLVAAAAQQDDRLGQLTDQAERWVTAAKTALGLEAPEVTIGDPCPYCWRKNCLVIAGDMSSARCSRCGKTWPSHMIGLLSILLDENRNKATATSDGVPCWMRDCDVVGPHQVHRDHRGRTWGDTCDVSAGMNA